RASRPACAYASCDSDAVSRAAKRFGQVRPGCRRGDGDADGPVERWLRGAADEHIVVVQPVRHGFRPGGIAKVEGDEIDRTRQAFDADLYRLHPRSLRTRTPSVSAAPRMSGPASGGAGWPWRRGSAAGS